jgi:serine/threonine-protein phosphatase 2B catalytic subunit
MKTESSAADQIRMAPHVPMPFRHRLTVGDIFDAQNKPRVDLLREHFVNEGRLDEAAALRILAEATAHFRLEKNLIHVEQPVVIVGDVHGQFYDLLRVFDIGGPLDHTSYLFLGDYVDRGYFSVEIVLYLWSLKIIYPNRLTLLRGNHECKHLADHFTFKRECLAKYSQKLYEACIKSFCSLPLCALVNKQLFCVHGGLSPELVSLSDLNKINREREPPSHGIMCDLLWSDPAHDFNDESRPDPSTAFTANQTRGCSFYYSYSAVSAFLKQNDLLCMVRAHEAQDTGFRMYRNIEKTGFPSVITLFSAPNYLDVYNNKAAVIVYERDTMNTRQFSASPHPYWLPNFMDVFTWSLPFVAEKITEMLMVVFKLNAEDVSAVADRREVMKAKLAAVSRMTQIYARIRERNEVFMDLRGESGDQREQQQQRGLSMLGEEFKRKRKLSLDEIKELDKQNECLPRTSSSASALI